MFENKEKTVSKVLEAARRKLLDTAPGTGWCT